MSDVNAYKQVDLNSKVSAASPGVLIQMLYDAAAKHLARVKWFIEQGDKSQEQRKLQDQALIKSIDIVAALQDALDTSLDADLPHNLDLLYDYIIRRLTQARIQQDLGAVVECQSLIETLKSGWDEIVTSQLSPTP